MARLRSVWGRLSEAIALVNPARIPPRAWLISTLLFTFATASVVFELINRVSTLRGAIIFGSMCVLTATTAGRYFVVSFVQPLRRRSKHHYDTVLTRAEDNRRRIDGQDGEIAALRARIKELEARLSTTYPEQRQASKPTPITE